MKWFVVAGLLACVHFSAVARGAESPAVREFLAKACYECHDADAKKGGLDLTALKLAPDDPNGFAIWVKVHDRAAAGEMPPAKSPRPRAQALDAAMSALADELTTVDLARQQRDGRARLRRLNRVEVENTLRDLLGMPALKIKDALPADGKAHGFDRLSDALDISFVHMESYLAAVDKALNAAMCALPQAPPVLKYRYRPWDAVHHEGRECEGSVALAVGNKTGIGLIGMKRDENFVADTGHHIRDDEPKATAFGLFRHEDADYRCTMTKIEPYVSGWYKLRVSGYSFGWDGKQVVPTDRHGALGWGVYQKGEYFGTVDLPPNQAAEREVTAWLERGGGMDHPNDDFIRIIGASLQNVRDYAFGKNKDLIGPPWAVPGIAIEWVEIEGPFNEQWPPASHRALFGDLPVKVWTKDLGIPKPAQQIWPRGNPNSEPKDIFGERGEKRPVVYVQTNDAPADARRLLRTFLRKAFRRPVTDQEVAEYAGKVDEKLAAGVAFEDAMRAAYREALTSPEFLFLREPAGRLDDYALAARLSYFLWSSLPDDELAALADAGTLSQPAVLRAQTERMLNDPKAARFVENFLGQWLNLRDIGATAPDRKLYPEFMPWLQEAMLMEAKAYLTELLTRDLGISNLVYSDFAYINEPLATLYGIDGVRGWDLQRITLPAGSPRGGFLTMAAVLKTTANGTTTSPVKRGAFVMDKLMGIVPTPPPPDVGSIEPDTRGATTIREQLAKHKRSATCASCHQKMDGYGFALESFDVVGEWRDHYRASGNSDPAGFHKIIHGKPIEYHFGPAVDCTGQTPDGRAFNDVNELRAMLAADPQRLARAFTGQLITYATGAEISFADRAAVDLIVKKAEPKGYGLRTLLVEVVQSELFNHK
ncbi:MAG TPA: DUF1592 domain-containing protein [Humisphaera sp.]|jgi:cytochrome c553|nr:DUF1592 domain-containing protein [Humisphaera sp.]